MDKGELESRLEAAEKEIKNLKAQLAAVQDEKEIPDFPEFKSTVDETWYIDNDLEISGPYHSLENIEDYNYFHTKEYAYEFAKKCKLIAMMLHCKWYLCRDYKENFEDDECKWYVYYANNTSHFAADYCVNDDHSSVYFDTEEAAQKCAEWLNEHWMDNKK